MDRRSFFKSTSLWLAGLMVAPHLDLLQPQTIPLYASCLSSAFGDFEGTIMMWIKLGGEILKYDWPQTG